MNMFSKCFLLLAAVIFVASPAYSLSNYQEKFADSTVVLGGADLDTKFYELEHMTYIDFLVEASAGSGTLTVQYASENPDKVAGALIIDDSVVGAFASGTPASLFAGGVTKNFVRLKLTCTAGPCTVSGMFTSKGRRNR